jgi:ABC-type sugar transport system ATPase subunit
VGAAIRTWELAKSCHRHPALRGINPEVPENVVFGYLGPNGAGKTTTIRLLAGLLPPTRGRAELLGMDTVRDRDQMQRRIGYLPGDFVAYPDLTGEQYLRYVASLRGGVNSGRAHVRARPTRPARVPGTRAGDATPGADGLPVLAHPVRGGSGCRPSRHDQCRSPPGRRIRRQAQGASAPADT